MPAYTRVIDADDWIGIYQDDKLVHEGHDIDLGYFIKLIEVPNIYYEDISNAGEVYLNEIGRFPNSLSEFRFKEVEIEREKDEDC